MRGEQQDENRGPGQQDPHRQVEPPDGADTEGQPRHNQGHGNRAGQRRQLVEVEQVARRLARKLVDDLQVIQPEDFEGERERHAKRHGQRHADAPQALPRAPQLPHLQDPERDDHGAAKERRSRVRQESQAEQPAADDRPGQRGARPERPAQGGQQQVQPRLSKAFGCEPRRVGRRIVEGELGADEEDERRERREGREPVEQHRRQQEQCGRRREIDVWPELIDHGGRRRAGQPARRRDDPRGHRVVPHVLVAVVGVRPVPLIEQGLRRRQLAELHVEARPGDITNNGPVLHERRGAERQGHRRHDGCRPAAGTGDSFVHGRVTRRSMKPKAFRYAASRALPARDRRREADAR